MCKIDQTNGSLVEVNCVSSGGERPREFEIDPTGNYVLVANMISNNVCTFKMNRKTGYLTLTQNIKTDNSPQGFGFLERKLN
ncbi:beta-propeller fold lactonase family protein [Flavivirga amylovorans]|uniref:beta-propeller fold lactonase family protein n=1 Tax=Flavivirga amylovorans TaxID=870486 RepID=UPI00349E5F64